MAKEKNKLSPEAARILERYRSAGKSVGPTPEGSAPPGEENAPPPRPPAPPTSATMRRSGTRGK